MTVIAWLKRLFRRPPRPPQPLPPGRYRLEAWIREANSRTTTWEKRSTTVETTEPRFASDIGGAFIGEIMSGRKDGDVMYVDDVSVRVAPE